MNHNNGTGFLPPIIKKNETPEPKVLEPQIPEPQIPEAQTPVFNELMTKVSDRSGGFLYPRGTPGYYPQSRLETVQRYGASLYVDQILYDEYVKKLKNTYPKCINIDKEIQPLDHGISGMVAQPFSASLGTNYYRLFDEVEKKCFLQPYTEARQNFERRQKLTKLLKEGISRQVLRALSKNELNILQQMRREQELMRIEQEAKNQRNRNEKRKLENYRKSNLLELNKVYEPNLLSFEPTKNGLNKRAKELEGLFGGRRITRKKSHTSEKKRKNQRKRKTYIRK